jgi:molybdenum cofactor biosynthesis protein B
MPGIDQSKQFVPLKIAVLTVSDTRSLADDKSGTTLVERIQAAGHAVAERAIVKDDGPALRPPLQGGPGVAFFDQGANGAKSCLWGGGGNRAAHLPKYITP